MAEYSINITPEDVAKAHSYVPIAEKKRVSQSIAFFCCEAAAQESADSMKDLPMLPYMVQEDRKLRLQFQMGLLADYFGMEYPEEIAIFPKEDGGTEELPLAHCMAEEEYDRWAGSHVVNQLERLKKAKGTDVSDKVFDILYDWKLYESMISAAIRDFMEQRNNGLNRGMEYISMFASDEVSKAMLQTLTKSKEELNETLNEVEAYKKRKGETDG